jgi:hypothetical protein
MITSTTKAWANAYLSIYEATNQNTGWLQVDNVSLRHLPDLPSTETVCFTPAAPIPTNASDGNTLIANGDFSGGMSSWGIFDAITHRITSGVFEFYRNVGGASAVVLQGTGAQIAANRAVEAQFQLGNSSSARKRVSIILHDGDWSDLQACWFYLPPNSPLQTYVMRTHTNELWTNAHISFYDGTATGGDAWIRLDNVSLRVRPSLNVVGTLCYEPGAFIP